MTRTLQASLRTRVARGDRFPLLWAMHETFRREFWLGGACQFGANLLQVLSPFTLRYLIQFATDAHNARQHNEPPPPLGSGLALVVGITAMQMLQSLGTNHFMYRGMMVGGQARAVLISLIFEKAMNISGRARAGGHEAGPQPAADSAPRAPTTRGAESEAGDDVRTPGPKPGPTPGPQTAAAGARGVAGDGTGWANGRVVNLMSVDTHRVDQACGLFHMAWTSPIACVFTLVLLLINLSYSALAGLSLFILGMPLLTTAVRSLFARRKLINKVTDQRVTLTQEILQAVRFVKFFGWETAVLARLRRLRDQEVRMIQALLAVRNAINAVSMSLPVFASMLAFVTFALTNHDLVPAYVFSSLALFNSLRLPLNVLPLILGQVTDAWSAIIRIQEYLLSEEQGEEATFDPRSAHAVEVRGADFTWERTATQGPDHAMPMGQRTAAPKADRKVRKAAAEQAEKEAATRVAPQSEDRPGAVTPDDTSTLVEERGPFQLQNVTFTIGRNELVAVIGGVGSGKSSLLAALAGDMRMTNPQKGEVIMGASRAFCPQYAWIQNTTVRDNILFGKAMDRTW